MSLYDYQYEDTGEIEEVFQLMDEEKLTEINGRKVTRLFPKPTAQCSGFQGYLSNALPTTIRGAKLVRDPKTGRRKPYIESRKHEREVMAKNDLVRESETFDGEEF